MKISNEKIAEIRSFMIKDFCNFDKNSILSLSRCFSSSGQDFQYFTMTKGNYGCFLIVFLISSAKILALSQIKGHFLPNLND